MSSPPLNFDINFQPQGVHRVSPVPYQQLSPVSRVVDPHGVEGFDTFGEVTYNPVLNPDEQSQEECKNCLTIGMLLS